MVLKIIWYLLVMVSLNPILMFDNICDINEEEDEYFKFVKVEDYPFMTFIVLSKEREGFQFCTSILLEEKHVLSLGLCFDYVLYPRIIDLQYQCSLAGASNFCFLAGRSHILTHERGHQSQGENIIFSMHPPINYFYFLNFLAIGTLKDPVQYSTKINPAQLPTQYTGFYHNYINEENRFQLIAVRQSICTDVFSMGVKRNYYTLPSGKKFLQLRSYNFGIPSKIKCDELIEKHRKIGIFVDVKKLICGKLLVDDPDCYDLFSGAVVDNKLKEVVGILPPPISCEPFPHMLIISTGALNSFIKETLG
uniref:Peptidase S1 domain-containing protein n=1 Tax=Clastoptera arizonana TaxID=38151 RepID=A0A1B6DC66_9HEMI